MSGGGECEIDGGIVVKVEISLKGFKSWGLGDQVDFIVAGRKALLSPQSLAAFRHGSKRTSQSQGSKLGLALCDGNKANAARLSQSRSRKGYEPCRLIHSTLLKLTPFALPYTCCDFILYFPAL